MSHKMSFFEIIFNSSVVYFVKLERVEKVFLLENGAHCSTIKVRLCRGDKVGYGESQAGRLDPRLHYA